MKRWMLGAVLFAIPAAAHAMYCTRPDPPSCLVYLGSANRDDFDSCRDEMTSYQSDVQQYVTCLRQEQNSVIDELNDAVAKFNACASSRYC